MSEPTVLPVTTYTDNSITAAKVMIERLDEIGRIRIATAPRGVDILLYSSPLLRVDQVRAIVKRLTQMADELEIMAESPKIPGKLTDEDIERLR